MKNTRLSNKKAETLLELVIVLFLLSLIIFEASAMLKNFTGFTKDYEENLESEDDINLFFSFIENDFTLYNRVCVKDDAIYFDKSSNDSLKTCEYILYKNRIKREAGSNLTGVTYFLNGVDEMSFAYNNDDNFIILKIMIKDKEYKKIFSTKGIGVIE